MRKNPVYVVDVLEDVVNAVNAVFVASFAAQLQDDISAVYYQHGHPLEIIDNLTRMTQNRTASAKKYPLIALFQDFDETTKRIDLYTEVQLHIIIATQTNPNYLAQERYTNTFKPILYPVLEEFLYQIELHPGIEPFNNYEYTKTDRLYWGRNGLYGNEKNVFNDYIDAIELTNFHLKIINTCYGN
jgi:hypothetical protein